MNPHNTNPSQLEQEHHNNGATKPEAAEQPLDVFQELFIEGRLGQYAVKFVGHDNPSVVGAKKIESDTFVELGDKESEVLEEFNAYDNGSLFLLLREVSSSDDESDPKILGMARFVPYIDGVGNKTMNDLAALLTLKKERDPKYFTDNNIIQLGEEPIIDSVERSFKKLHGCTDLDKVMDIATLAPDMELDFKKKFDVIDALLKAMDVYTLDLFRSGNLTHLTQFTEERMHNVLKNNMGYPMDELFNLPSMVYDTFDNGNGDNANMVATPSVISLEKLMEVFEQNKTVPVSKHMGSVVAQLALNLLWFNTEEVA
jgi:hypothetical protein